MQTVGNDLVQPGLEEAGPHGEAVRRRVGDAILASKAREFNTLGLVLGADYHGSPVVVPDGSEPPLREALRYIPSASPGCLAPHLWLDDGSSLYDHFAAGFTLPITEGDAGRADDMMAVAARLGIPLTVLALADERLRGLYQARFILIRPDQHVAWRADELPLEPAGLLRHVTGQRQ